MNSAKITGDSEQAVFAPNLIFDHFFSELRTAPVENIVFHEPSQLKKMCEVHLKKFTLLSQVNVKDSREIK